MGINLRLVTCMDQAGSFCGQTLPTSPSSTLVQAQAMTSPLPPVRRKVCVEAREWTSAWPREVCGLQQASGGRLSPLAIKLLSEQ